MKYTGKNKLLLMLGIAILVVASILLLLIHAASAKPILYVIAGITVFIALAVAAVALAKYKSVEKRVAKLPGDFQSAYLNIHELLGTYEMTAEDRRNILSMVLEIFEHAHLDHRTLEDVTGSDLAAFTDGFVNETGRAHTFGYRISYSTALFIVFLLFLKAYKVFRTGAISLAAFRSETLDVGIVLTYLIISYAFFPWMIATTRRSAREQWHGARRLLILFPMLIPVGLMAALILIDAPKWRAFLDQPFPLFTTPLSVALGVLLLVGAILLTRFFRRR